MVDMGAGSSTDWKVIDACGSLIDKIKISSRSVAAWAVTISIEIAAQGYHLDEVRQSMAKWESLNA